MDERERESENGVGKRMRGGEKKGVRVGERVDESWVRERVRVGVKEG